MSNDPFHQSQVHVQVDEKSDVIFGKEIENRVFQSIILQTLAKISGIALVEGNIIDHLFGRASMEGIRGVYVEKELSTDITTPQQERLVIRVEVNVEYGLSIPQKAEEIQKAIVQDLSYSTGLSIASVHIVFKNLLPPAAIKEGASASFTYAESTT